MPQNLFLNDGARAGFAGGIRPIDARVGIGLAVRKGISRPDISSDVGPNAPPIATVESFSTGDCPMADTPTFGRYAEIPYDQMTPEQQDAYRWLIETRGRLPGPNKIYVHNPKLAGAARRPLPHWLLVERA